MMRLSRKKRAGADPTTHSQGQRPRPPLLTPHVEARHERDRLVRRLGREVGDERELIVAQAGARQQPFCVFFVWGCCFVCV